VDVASGVVLLAGALACVAAAVRRGRWPVCAAFAAALLAAAFEDGLVVACGLGVAGAALLVVDRAPAVTLLSWLDAAIGGTAAAALTVVLGGAAAPAVAAGGAVGALALSRWRPGWTLLVAIAGLGGLAGGPAIAPLAAFGLAGAAWLREPAAQPGPEFSRVVLGVILLAASTALAMLGVGQFTDLDTAGVVLAIATVLAGMARAGLTVTDRLRESHRQAVTDDLAGLGNRRYLVDRLGAAIESTAARDGMLALLLIDLDGFKELNDTLGHTAGDEVLRQIGPRLAQILREQDTLARLGGDEFAVVLAPGDEATASAAGLRLRAALEQSFGVGGIRVHVDASVGIALFPDHARDALGLLQRADVAMYEAKRMRTGHEVYLAARDHHSRDRLLLIGELHGALRAGQLVLHYQPKADLRTGSVTGVEALVRWEHPDRGLLGPAHFLPLVEQSGLTRALTTFVLDRALDEIGEHRRRGFDLTVAVNLGPADLLDLGLPSEVERLLHARGFPPEQLVLEVSEDVVMTDVERTADVLDGLRATGALTALDDFGAGHAALSHLKRLNLDTLKIDRGFVMRLSEDARDAAIARSLVDLGRRLGMGVVAEGVEDEETWRTLAGWGCDEAQGHLLGRPMPAGELTAWLQRLARERPDLPGSHVWSALRP
ncbi:MAG: putative bifunctional diguanylate cyclase/phosphodiesterase, partial [Solirubrobacteraceae bacterium]